MSSRADIRQPFHDAIARRLRRVTWSGPDDPPPPSKALREYAARLEAEALRIRKRAEEIEDTLTIVRECIAAIPAPMPPHEPAESVTAVVASPDADGPPLALARGADPETEPLPPLQVWMLGDFRLGIGERIVRPGSSTRVWQMLKFLITRDGGPVAADVLADTFWRKSSASAALQSVYSAVHALRRLLSDFLPGEYVVSQGGFYSLAPGAEIHTDVAFFRKRMDSASRADARGDHEEARACLTEAVNAYRGEYLPGDPYERWVAEERETLATAHLRALEKLSRLTEAVGLADRAAEYRLRILDSDPLREDSHQALIRYYLASGQRIQAIRQYRELEEVLDRELGIRPDPATRALVEGILPH